MRLQTKEALAALDGRVVNRERLPATLAVSTDSRTIRPSETFLALRGERYDGHGYVAAAVAHGASAAIVDDAAAIPAGTAGIVVADTLVAYLALGGLARAHRRGPVVAITGSTGKTTTKTLLLQLLAAAGMPAHASPANENNEVGVAKFLLAADDGDPRIGIVEMGARKYGDIEPLVAAARPQLAILTNVGEAHLEIMGSRERLAETKWGIFARGARAVLNLGDAVSRERAGSLAEEPRWFGIDDERPPQRARGVVVQRDAILAIEHGDVRVLAWSAGLPGEHNRRNLAAAVIAAWELGVDPADIVRLAPSLTLPGGRYERIETSGAPTIVYDAYNASMSGALATLAAFGEERAARRIVVLGSMAELGEESQAMHERVGGVAASVADVLLVGGAFADALADGARDAGMSPERIVSYEDNDAAVAWLRAHATADDLVLLKGSRMYRMEQIVAGIAR